MRKFLAQSEHSVNICHDCYYCFIITIVVILALGKLNMPAQASPGRIHSCTQNRKRSHWHRSQSWLGGRGGAGSLLPTPSTQSHAAPHLRPICRRLLLWSWQQPQRPPRARQQGRGARGAARGAHWEERTCRPAPGRLEGGQAVAGAGAQAWSVLSGRPLVLQGRRAGRANTIQPVGESPSPVCPQ